jgi:hypothetical protein
MQQIRSTEKNKKAPNFGSLLICISKMVRHRVSFWNPFEDSLLRVDAKLTKLGFRYCKGEVIVCELDEVDRV